MYIGIAGVLLAVIGLAALLYPIYLDQYDVYGIKITCGNSLRSNLGQAGEASAADGQSAVRQCGTALLIRRAWAISAVAIGWLLITGFLALWVHNDKLAAESSVQC
jgi:hypothetical protein